VATELTCVLFALAREAMFFRRELSGETRILPAPCEARVASLHGERLLVLIAGMGASAAERVVGWVLKDAPCRPGRLVSAGFCGALVPGLEVGDLVRPEEVIEVGRQDASPVSRGALVTSSTPVLSRQERQSLHERCGAVAVDMESAVVARLAREQGVSFACLRSVSDALESTVSPALVAALRGEAVDLRRLAGAVLRRPLLVRELARLARQSRRAAAALSSGLLEMLRPPAHHS
jgi:nucleoside phosphorylase